MPRPAVLLAVLLLVACGEGAGRPHSATRPVASAVAPTFSRPEEKHNASTPKAPAEVAAPPESSAEAVASAAPADPPKADPPKVDDVDVTTVGMHIGGEKNTDELKRPLRDAVRSHYDELRGCYGESDRPADATFGVDMRIGKDGGRARISNPRSGLGKTATSCMVDVMEAVEFPKPPNGPQMVSYSVRFKRK